MPRPLSRPRAAGGPACGTPSQLKVDARLLRRSMVIDVVVTPAASATTTAAGEKLRCLCPLSHCVNRCSGDVIGVVLQRIDRPN